MNVDTSEELISAGYLLQSFYFMIKPVARNVPVMTCLLDTHTRHPLTPRQHQPVLLILVREVTYLGYRKITKIDKQVNSDNYPGNYQNAS